MSVTVADSTAVLTATGAAAVVPAQAGLVLATLFAVVAVANLPLAMVNVALPSIGAYFDASQTQLNLVAVAYSLGLACSALWLGALGDRYGGKQIAIVGVALAIPAARAGYGIVRHHVGRYRWSYSYAIYGTGSSFPFDDAARAAGRSVFPSYPSAFVDARAKSTSHN